MSTGHGDNGGNDETAMTHSFCVGKTFDRRSSLPPCSFASPTAPASLSPFWLRAVCGALVLSPERPIVAFLARICLASARKVLPMFFPPVSRLPVNGGVMGGEKVGSSVHRHVGLRKKRYLGSLEW